MRFISQYPNYGVQIRPQRVEPLGDGTSRVVQAPLYVTFTAVDAGGMLYDKERILAQEHFKFHGQQQHEDEFTPVDTIHRLSTLDTEEDAEKNGWSPEDVALIEQVLITKARTTPNAVLMMEGKPVDAPFPAYDSYTGDPEELVLTLSEQGHDLASVLHYEQNFGPKRPELIEALQIAVEAIKGMQVPA